MGIDAPVTRSRAHHEAEALGRPRAALPRQASLSEPRPHCGNSPFVPKSSARRTAYQYVIRQSNTCVLPKCRDGSNSEHVCRRAERESTAARCTTKDGGQVLLMPAVRNALCHTCADRGGAPTTGRRMLNARQPIATSGEAVTSQVNAFHQTADGWKQRIVHPRQQQT